LRQIAKQSIPHTPSSRRSARSARARGGW
jgi:hypothetical protein